MAHMKNRIGIVGGGQLARMLAFEAKRMGFIVTVIDPSPNSPGGQVCDEQIVASLDDEGAMGTLSKKSDFITIEWELANDKILQRFVDKGVTVNPSPRTLRMVKDKLSQKRFLSDNGIPVPEFAEVGSISDIKNMSERLGYPVMLKARFGGYDGHGNALLTSAAGIPAAMMKLGTRDLYLEGLVRFKTELSVMAARDVHGNIAVYPVSENVHINSILHTTIAPARVSARVRKKANSVALSVMRHLEGAGVFGIEMFLDKRGNVLVNEIAPRVHNSGHYTIGACATSQFEQHIRALTGLPLGSTEMLVPHAAMVNILGNRNGLAKVAGLEKALSIPGVSVHIYGKKDTRTGRKMGHITATGRTAEEAIKRATSARNYISV